jgi:hypothetical protein
MNLDLRYIDYNYFERSGYEKHAINYSNGNCIWCNKDIGHYFHGNPMVIEKGLVSYYVPYCSNKCKSEDPNSVEFIISYISACDSFKPRFIKAEILAKEKKESKLNEELIAYSKKKKILNIKLILLALIILATLYLINGMNIVGYFFGLLLFLIVRSLNTISKPSSYN